MLEQKIEMDREDIVDPETGRSPRQLKRKLKYEKKAETKDGPKIQTLFDDAAHAVEPIQRRISPHAANR